LGTYATATFPAFSSYYQVVEELFTYWVLEDADQEFEELEDALIVSGTWYQSQAAFPFPFYLFTWLFRVSYLFILLV